MTCEITYNLKQLLFDDKYIAEHRLFPKAFTRQRKLAFATIIVSLIHHAKKSLQIVCNLMSDLIKVSKPPSKQAFSQARKKISYTGFKGLFEEALRTFYTNNNKGLWRDYRVFGVDGSLCRLPVSYETEAYFGRWEKRKDSSQPVLGRLSEVVDITSRMIVSGRLETCRTSEVLLAKEQLLEVVGKMRAFGQNKMLFVYDRGYGSGNLIKDHLDLGVDCIIRLRTRFNSLVDEAVKKGERDVVLQLWKDMPSMRILVCDLSSGEKEILLTTQTDQEKYPYASIFEVYKARWAASEETYKLQKIAMELENFSGKTVQNVLQDYWSNLIALNLMSAFEVEKDGYQEILERVEDKMNRSVVFGSIQEDVFRLLVGEIEHKEFSEKFNQLATRHRIKVRPNRQYSRENVRKMKRHHIFRRVI